MMLGWIDGVLYIYQGDEDPAAYHLEGENLEAFFTDLIAAKREYLPNTLDTAYLQTGSAISPAAGLTKIPPVLCW